MGMSVSANLISITKLEDEFKKHGFDHKQVRSFVPEFGEVHDDYLLTVQCDYWDEYDPYFGLMTFIERYCKQTFDTEVNGFELVHNAEVAECDHGYDKYEVYEKFKIEDLDEEE